MSVYQFLIQIKITILNPYWLAIIKSIKFLEGNTYID